MRWHYLALTILTTANGTTFAFLQPISMAWPKKITSLMASDTPEGPESELFDFLKSIIEKPIDWNINEPGKSPFGFDKNAELWNGRIAQISFVWIFLQEWIQGKGVLQSIIESDLASNILLEIVCLMLLFVSLQFCMLPFEQNVKIRVPREWLENPPPPTVRSEPPERKKPMKSDVRRWNFNGDDKAPYGFDLNAEVWNGRVAMVCFAWVFLQEWIQDKGLLTGLEEKHGPSEAALLLFVIGLSGFITYLHNMFSLEAEEYRKSRMPSETEAPKLPSTVAGNAFKFGQMNGDIRALNGQQNFSGTSRPPAQNGPPGTFRQPVSAGMLSPYPESPHVTPETLASQRTQLFKSDALSSAAKGDPSFLDQIAPNFSSGLMSTEILPPEVKPGVRPFPKPESFSFSPDIPIAQWGKSSIEQSWANSGTEQSTGDEMARASSQSEDTPSHRTASPAPISYPSEPFPPPYQSSPYNMPDPTKRTSYLDKLGPS